MSMNDQMTPEFTAPEIMHPEHFGPVCETLSSPVQPVDYGPSRSGQRDLLGPRP